MKNLTLENIAAVCGGTYHGKDDLRTCEVNSITTDSREASEGCLFAAIAGERVDGHDYIGKAADKGAMAVLCEKEPAEDIPYILVKSTLEALQKTAAYYLEQLNIPVVGITGSVGKTSTKETIASVLAQKYRTLKTPGNFNNELGLPLTVFRLRDEDEIAVLEMGISHFGEMSLLAKIARPETCVFTNIGTAHLEYLKDRDGIFRAKTEMLEYMKPEGSIVLNGDDDKLSALKEYKGIRPVFYGFGAENDVRAENVKSLGFEGTDFRMILDGNAFDVHMPVPGRHMVMNALAAAAVGHIYGLTDEEIRAGIGAVETLKGRFHVVRTPRYLVADDCYNANPVSMKASLDILKEGRGRRVAILGDMGELGEKEKDFHREVGRHAAECGIDLLICAGPLSGNMAEAAREYNPSLPVVYETDRDSLMQKLPGLLKDGDTILVKASHFMQFEKIVDYLIPDQSSSTI